MNKVLLILAVFGLAGCSSSQVSNSQSVQDVRDDQTQAEQRKQRQSESPEQGSGELKIPISYVYGSKLVNSFVSVPVVSAKGITQVKVGHTAYDFPRIPSQALSAALKKYTKAKLFRVSWSCSGVHLNFSSTVLYNRNSKNIKYFLTGSRGSGDEYRKFQSRALVSHVTDDMIHKLSTSNKGETQISGPLGPLDLETAGFIRYITRYGAKVVSSDSYSQKLRPAPRNLSGIYGSVSLFTPDGSNPVIGESSNWGNPGGGR